MINLRYHIVSITAVFLALGIGITLGSTFIGRETLDRIDQNVKAARAERDRVRAELGERGYVNQVTGQAQVLRGRLARQHGDRFSRPSGLRHGYDIGEVDDLRDKVFHLRRGSRAYEERAVDSFIDRVIAVIIKVS